MRARKGYSKETILDLSFEESADANQVDRVRKGFPSRKNKM